MRINEIAATDALGSDAKGILTTLLRDRFDLNLSDADVNVLVDALAVSDFLAVLSAARRNDVRTVKSLLMPHIQLEYSLPGRANVQSAATKRQNAITNQQQNTTSSSTTKKPVAGGNIVATGRPNNGAAPVADNSNPDDGDGEDGD